MRKWLILPVLALICMYGDVSAESLLQAASFPKTFQDLSFTERMEVKREGYEDFDPVYENGVCVSGCAYRGITIEEEEKLIERNTQLANAQLDAYLQAHPDIAAEYTANTAGTSGTSGTAPAQETSMPTATPSNGDLAAIFNRWRDFVADNQVTSQPVTPTTQPNPTTTQPSKPPAQQPSKPQTQTQPPSSGGTAIARQCKQYSSVIRPGLDAVMQAPLDIELVVSSDFGSRKSPCSGCSSNHRGLDFSASTGTNVYAPANGTVTVVKSDAKGCGKQIQIKHPDGLITQYCHLSEQTVSVGQQIQGGCLIGRVGNTGSSTGPHLHYALMNAPQSFIDPLWQRNMLGRSYRFKSNSVVSPEHSGKSLPGRTN